MLLIRVRQLEAISVSSYCMNHPAEPDLQASGTVKKVIEINKFLLGTMAGGAADCQYWYVALFSAT